MLEDTLTTLGFSGGAIRVYGKLLVAKEASAKRLAELADLPRTTVYGYLSELEKAGLVLELDVDNKKVFCPDDPANILALLEKRSRDLEVEKKKFKEALPSLRRKSESAEPRIKFYSGKEGFVAVLADVLRHTKNEVCFMWPAGEMTSLIGNEHLSDFTYRRVQEDITVRSIWPAGTSLKGFHPTKESIRLAPSGVEWQMGTILYGDKVAFISSRKERFAFVVTSADFAQLQQVQFELLWKNSHPRKT